MKRETLSAVTFWLGVVLIPATVVIVELCAQFGVSLPATLTAHIPGVPTASDPNLYAFVVLLLVGVGLLGGWVAYLRTQPGTSEHVFKQFRFLRETGGAAWGIGSGLAALVTAFFYLLPVGNQHYERFTGILGIYGAFVGGTLAIDALYNRIAPITDMPALLQKMREDLESEGASRRLVLVYPALTIGFFRDARGTQPPPEGHPWKRFEEALLTAFTRAAQADGRALVVTYPVAKYRELYETYALGFFRRSTAADLEPVEREQVETTVSKSVQLANFAAHENRFYEIPPEQFPDCAVVIGSACYLLPSYGLPLHRNGRFIQAPEGGKLAHVIAFRREDATLAGQLRDHIDALVPVIGHQYIPPSAGQAGGGSAPPAGPPSAGSPGTPPSAAPGLAATGAGGTPGASDSSTATGGAGGAGGGAGSAPIAGVGGGHGALAGSAAGSSAGSSNGSGTDGGGS